MMTTTTTIYLYPLTILETRKENCNFTEAKDLLNHFHGDTKLKEIKKKYSTVYARTDGKILCVQWKHVYAANTFESQSQLKWTLYKKIKGEVGFNTNMGTFKRNRLSVVKTFFLFAFVCLVVRILFAYVIYTYTL